MKEIPGYKTLSLLHAGSHFQVYRAFQLEDQAVVAVKLPKSEAPSKEETYLLAREHAILSLLAGRGAVKTLGLKRIDNIPLLVLEDMRAQRLAEFTRRHFLPLTEFLDLAWSSAEALDRVHKAGVRHGDVTASNILISHVEATSLFIDFGAGFRPGLPLSRQTIGRPTHMAPELSGQPERSLSVATDIYALGVTLYELLTRRLPFESTDPMELVHSHLTKIPKDPRSIRENLPPAVAGIVMKCLAKDPGARYRSAAGLAADLGRCRKALSLQDAFALFELGEDDAPDILEAPVAMVGRQSETYTLVQAFDRVSDGAFETILIEGASGMGKTRLVEELKSSLWERRIFFLEGKWEALRRDAPYLALAQALARAVRRMLGLPERELAAWRQRLTQALGDDAGLLVKAIPELALVIQPGASPVPGGPIEAKSRLARQYGAMLWTLSFYSQAVVLFLDDLHWADADSLDLLKALLWDSNASNCLVIMTCRDAFLARNPAAKNVVEALGQYGRGRVSRISLGPLDRAAVTQYLGMALGKAPEEVAEEAEVFYEKSGGAPYFMAELVRNAAFVRSLGARYKNTPPARQGRTANVAPGDGTGAQDAASRIDTLPKNTLEALQLGACLGSRFDAMIPARMLGVDEDRAFSLFQPCLDRGILTLDVERDLSGPDRGQLPMRFAHDLVLEAVYSSLPPPRRAEAHERLGRYLIQAYPLAEHPTRIYAIADQILLCGHRLEQTQGRELFADALCKAAHEAINAAAFPAAWTFASAGMRLLGLQENRGDRLALDLWQNGARAALSVGMDDEFETVSRQGLRYAGEPEDKAEFLALRAGRHVSAGRHEAATAEVRRALKILGLRNLDRTDLRHEAEALIQKTQDLLGQRSVESLADQAMLVDRAAQAELDLINAGILSVVNVDMELYVYLIARAVFLQADKGLYPPAFPAFACLGNLLGIWRRDYQTSLALTRLGLELCRRHRHYESFLCIADIVSRSTLPSIQSFHWIEALFDEALAVADATGTSYLRSVFIRAKARLDFFVGRNLATLAGALDRLGQEALRLGNRFNLLDGACMSFGLKGLTNGKTSAFPGRGKLSEGKMRRELASRRHHVALTDYKTCKIASSYLLKRYRAAWVLYRSPGSHPLADKATMAMTLQRFYAAMSLMALCDEQNIPLDGERRDFIEESLSLLGDLAVLCPINFSSWHQLLQAEFSRVTGSPAYETTTRFEQALRVSRRNGFVQNEALGRELLGRFFLSQGREALARPVLAQAIAGYRAWGAERLATRLQDEFAPLLGNTPDESLPSGLEATPMSLEALDFLTVLKSARIICAETNPSRLIVLLMGILAESAGAERGAFFRISRGDLQMVARSCEKDPLRFELMRAGHEPQWDAVSTALRFVARTGESLVLADASTDSIFGVEAQRRAAPVRSLLCLPIPGFSGPVGLVYLENNQIPGAFTAARLGVVRTLAAQAAVALENAALFDSVRVAEKKYRGIVDSAPLGIFQATREGVLMDVNPALADMLGFVSQRHLLATQRKVFDFCIESWDPRRLLKRHAGERNLRGLEMPLNCHDGSIRWVRLHIQPERDAAGRIARFLGMVEDITALKQSAEQLQRLNRDQLRIQEQERLRIAMDLHDNVAQNLLAIKLALAKEASRPELGAVDGLNKTLEKLNAGLADALAAVRDLSHALQPPDLDGLGLAGALENFCRDCSAKSGAEVDFLAAGLESLDLDSQAQAHCYRLVQEGVNNALRHSGASVITVRLTVSHPHLFIRIKDNGCGFNVEAKSVAALREKRMGLRGMRERAHILGGTLQIKSHPGEGTCILVEVANRREHHGG